MIFSYIDDVANAIFGVAHPGGTCSPDERLLYRIYAVLALAKGRRVTARDVHDAWSAWSMEVNPGHTSIRPFEQLPAYIQQLDEPYVTAIHQVLAAREGQP